MNSSSPWGIDRRRQYHAPLVAVLLLALVLLAYAGLASRTQAIDQSQAGLPNAPLALQGRAWVAAGPVELLPDDKMLRIGHTVGGDTLYAKPALAGGGGGGAISNTTPADSVVYLRVGADRYQPLMLAHVLR